MTDYGRSARAVLCLFAGLAWFCPKDAPPPIAPDDDPTLVGLSLPSRSALVAPEASGTIVRIPVADGDPVSEGQVLFELSSQLERLEVERLRALAESNLLELRARTSLGHAEREAGRVRELRDQEISSDSDLQKQTYEVELARLLLDQARLEKQQALNSLAQAEERLAQRTLRSPISGVVVQRLRNVGESVEKFVPVVEVIGLDPLWVEFECPVALEPEFRVGTKVELAPVVRPDDVRVGRVVYGSMRATAASHTFMVRATVANSDHTWKSGLKMVIRRSDRVDADSSPAVPPSPPGK